MTGKTMGAVRRVLAVLMIGGGLAAAFAGCSSERLLLTLGVEAAPNPVAGAADANGRRWDYQLSISNPNAVGVVVEYYHAGISDTDTGYEQELQLVTESSPIIGVRIEAGAAVSYGANRTSGGKYDRATERRVYHALGDDGTYYSGEVLIELQ